MQTENIPLESDHVEMLIDEFENRILFGFLSLETNVCSNLWNDNEISTTEQLHS